MERTRLAELIAFDARRMAKHRVFETDRTLTDLYCLDPGQEQLLHVHEGSDKVVVVLAGRALGWSGGQSRGMRCSGCSHGSRPLAAALARMASSSGPVAASAMATRTRASSGRPGWYRPEAVYSPAG